MMPPAKAPVLASRNRRSSLWDYSLPCGHTVYRHGTPKAQEAPPAPSCYHCHPLIGRERWIQCDLMLDGGRGVRRTK